jgi:uncharacterized protein
MALNFEWDEAKEKANLRQHRVSFEEAKTVFGDPLSLTIPDPRHSEVERRYTDIGCSSEGHLLVVTYTERQSTVRLISCRRATQVERRSYEEGST